MTLTTALYLVNVIHKTDIALATVFFIGLFCIVISLIGYISTTDEYERKAHLLWAKPLKLWWIIPLSLLLSIPFPSKSTMYLMLGTVYLEQSNLPSKVSEALELKLDQYIDELRENKNDK